MHRLLPGSLAEVDLDDAYWVDDPGRQHVRGVMIASADGAAQRGGRAGGLAGPADKRLFAVLRAHADALLVGATTARTEQYGGHRPSPARAAWRTERGLDSAAVLAVVTRSCDLDINGPLFTDTVLRPVVITCAAAPADSLRMLRQVADVVVAGERDVDMAIALDALAERGLRRISCEGGPTVLAQVAATGRLDELSLTIAPLLLAGGALRMLDGPSIEPPSVLRLVQVLAEDQFLFLLYRVQR